MKIRTALLLLFITNSIYTFAQPGIPDPTFGTDGIVTTDFANTFDIAESIIVQSDGKIVAAGVALDEPSGDRKMALARYLADGTLDPSFGTGGKTSTDFQGKSALCRAVRQLPTGKLLLAGSTNLAADTRDFALVRYFQDGTLDPSFGTEGKMTVDLGGNDIGSSLAIQIDRKILIAGSSDPSGNPRSFALARLNSNGSIDDSFGTNGIAITDFDGDTDVSYSIAIQNDGKILLAGSATNSTTGMLDFALTRYNTDGTIDTSFGDNGKVQTDFANDNDVAYSMVIRVNGKILLGGFATNSAGDKDVALAQYNSDGSLDTTFGLDGKVVTDMANESREAAAISLENDGKILVAGTTINDDFNLDFTLIRYLNDGTLDMTFGQAGIVSTDLFLANDLARTIISQQDGKILIAGQTTNGLATDFLIARFFSDVEVATSQINSSVTELSLYPNPTQQELLLEYTLKEKTAISIDLYHHTGQFIRTLLHQQNRNTGKNQEHFTLDSTLPAGHYLLKINDGKTTRAIFITMID